MVESPRGSHAARANFHKSSVILLATNAENLRQIHSVRIEIRSLHCMVDGNNFGLADRKWPISMLEWYGSASQYQIRNQRAKLRRLRYTRIFRKAFCDGLWVAPLGLSHDFIDKPYTLLRTGILKRSICRFVELVKGYKMHYFAFDFDWVQGPREVLYK